MNWPSNRLQDLLGIEHPIIQAPMAGSSTAAMASAASNAGGLGSVGAALMPMQKIREEVAQIRSQTNRAININFFAHREPEFDGGKIRQARARLQPYFDEHELGEVPDVTHVHPAFDAEGRDLMLELAPRIVSFHFGLPADDLWQPLKDAGMIILSSATSVREARDLEARGVDAVIAQGYEAGGHRGTYLGPFETAGTFALVPQIVDAVGLPVIAAGGIMDGRGIAAALMLGADGVQIGTAFLTTEESGIPPAHRRALLDSSDDSTRLTRLFSGRPARGVVNRYMSENENAETQLPDFPIMNNLTGTLRKASAASDSPDFIALWSGQGGAMCREMSVADLMQRLIEETEEALSNTHRR